MRILQIKDIMIKFPFQFYSNITGMRARAVCVFATSFGILALWKKEHNASPPLCKPRGVSMSNSVDFALA
jgi:hypothetical protein